jgi:predicted MFS family arabinose efflux permease
MTKRTEERFSSYQRFVVAVLAFVQFTLVLDFMILSPLGAQLIPALQITTAQFGLVVSTYAFSAGAAGILAAGFADRFDRKKLLLFFYAGFMAGTLLCGLASSYHFLVFARLITGLFAGVVGSVSFAIITDLFPLQMRGRVMGIVQTAFAASTVLGIPVSLLLANHWGWNTPFLVVVVVGTIAGAAIWIYLRPVDAHLKQHTGRNPFEHLADTLSNPRYLQGFATTGLLSVGGFMLMPFMTVFTVNNLGLPVSKLPLMYVLVGTFSMVAGPLIGRASDAWGKLMIFSFGCLITIIMVMIYTHLPVTPLWLLVIILALLQVGIASRMITASALTSALPKPADRGSYMAVSSSLQQVSGGIAAVISGFIVVQDSSGKLLHFATLGYVLVCTTVITLVMMYFIDRLIRHTQKPFERILVAPEVD